MSIKIQSSFKWALCLYSILASAISYAGKFDGVLLDLLGREYKSPIDVRVLYQDGYETQIDSLHEVFQSKGIQIRRLNSGTWYLLKNLSDVSEFSKLVRAYEDYFSEIKAFGTSGPVTPAGPKTELGITTPAPITAVLVPVTSEPAQKASAPSKEDLKTEFLKNSQLSTSRAEEVWVFLEGKVFTDRLFYRNYKGNISKEYLKYMCHRADSKINCEEVAYFLNLDDQEIAWASRCLEKEERNSERAILGLDDSEYRVRMPKGILSADWVNSMSDRERNIFREFVICSNMVAHETKIGNVDYFTGFEDLKRIVARADFRRDPEAFMKSLWEPTYRLDIGGGDSEHAKTYLRRKERRNQLRELFDLN